MLNTTITANNLLAAFIVRQKQTAIPAPAKYSHFDIINDALGLEIGEEIRHGDETPIITKHYGFN